MRVSTEQLRLGQACGDEEIGKPPLKEAQSRRLQRYIGRPSDGEGADWR